MIADSQSLPPPPLRQAIRRKLLLWFTHNARDLPWRRRTDPYAQWVAEIMLQQTQVVTVIPYYERFMRRFVDVASLARASDDELLSHWQGLGYYRRAENLRRAARQITANGGVVPDSVNALETLPGIGRYTAGAIASIAFGRRAAAVDGNVTRVLSRLFHITDDVTSPGASRRIWSLAECLLPTRRCGDFNQALMELGALVCVSGAPRCHVCPLRSVCAARRDGDPSSLPRKPRSRGVRDVRHVVAMIRRDDAFLMVKRPPGGLWGRLWEFPNEAYAKLRNRSAQLQDVLARFGLTNAKRSKPFGVVTHRLTHRQFRFDLFLIDDARVSVGTGDRQNTRWFRATRPNQIPMSTACRKMLRAVWNA